MHSCMHAWMGRRAIGHTAIGHTAPTPISHIAHPSHTPTWLKSHVHYESFRTHAPRDVPKINTHAVGWTSTHPPTASVIIRCSFFAANPRDVPICRSADLPIARPRTDAWVVVVTRATYAFAAVGVSDDDRDDAYDDRDDVYTTTTGVESHAWRRTRCVETRGRRIRRRRRRHGRPHRRHSSPIVRPTTSSSNTHTRART